MVKPWTFWFRRFEFNCLTSQAWLLHPYTLIDCCFCFTTDPIPNELLMALRALSSTPVEWKVFIKFLFLSCNSKNVSIFDLLQRYTHGPQQDPSSLQLTFFAISSIFFWIQYQSLRQGLTRLYRYAQPRGFTLHLCIGLWFTTVFVPLFHIVLLNNLYQHDH